MNTQISPYLYPGIISENRIEQQIRVRQVLDAVCRYFKVDMAHMREIKNFKQRIRIRQIAIHLLTKIDGLRLCDIAPIVGLKEHTNVIHHRDYALNMIDTEPQFAEDVAAITEKIPFLANIILTK